jgi:hypothetical protein
MIASEAVVYTSPHYFWSFSAQMKAFIDRHYALAVGFEDPGHKSMVGSQRCALAFTADGGLRKSFKYIEDPFKRLVYYTRSKFGGQLIIPACTTPSELGDKIRKQVETFAERFWIERTIGIRDICRDELGVQ